MRDKLHQSYRVQREVSRRGYYEGIIEVSRLSRLLEYLSSDDAELRLRFEISNSDFDLPRIKGQYEVALFLECQRCLNGMEVQVQQEFELLIDAPDDLLQETSLDTVYSEEGEINLFEIIEDELILSLPLVPMHENATCNEHWSKADPVALKPVTENPFLVLKKLKTPN